MTDDINCDEYFLFNCGVKLAIADFLDVKVLATASGEAEIAFCNGVTLNLANDSHLSH
ncbi:hypothetical protein [uncultured Gilliamella sp.]|uniref:hypothetical protein n=1 Tax=uncultured Gilliamella sp. TaxID=1193505 RepID=UPI0025DE2102|nr:hypothetical protein [uncultured Gilliamella sp.]